MTGCFVAILAGLLMVGVAAAVGLFFTTGVSLALVVGGVLVVAVVQSVREFWSLWKNWR